MSEHSNIEWTDASLGLTVGCDKCSTGCANCYAMKDAIRMAKNPNPKVSEVYSGLARRQANKLLNWTGVVRCVPHRLVLPFGWASPKRIFVCNQSDLFHDDVPDDFIRRVFEMMAAASWHTFQCLTKRDERLERLAPSLVWPANVWMGVSVENQDNASRVKNLRQVPAQVRFLSVEPMLGPVTLDLAGIDWVITGGESGRHARPFDPAWALSVRDQCKAAGVAFFHKQNGGRNKKKTGRKLDGRTWDEMPPIIPARVPSRAERKRLAQAFAEPERFLLKLL